MAKSNPTENFFSPDFSGSFDKFKGFGFDFGALMETHRRNVQALSDANRLALESLQEIAQMQSAAVSRLVEDGTTIAREITTEGAPEEKFARQTDLARKTYESAVGCARQISETLGKSNKAASDIIHKRVSASLCEMKSAAEKKASKGK